MKIALFTPFSPDATMGRYAAQFLPALCQRHEVEIWCPPSQRLLTADVPVIPFEPIDALGDPRLDRYDLILYQMGNDPTWFSRILEVSRHCPGAHILHDFVMHHMLAHHCLHILRQPLVYVRWMEEAYGAMAREYVERTLLGDNPGLWETDDVARFPLFEPILRNSLGAVVHSRFFLTAVRRRFRGPSTVINIAAPPAPQASGISAEELGAPPGRVLMVSTGYIGRSKLHAEVIRAMRQAPELARRAYYVIVGADDPAESPRLRAMVREYGLEGSVHFAGFEPDERMHAWIGAAGLCINLRRPNTEGASWSLIDQMQHGKAVVVLRSGCYAEPPEDTVAGLAPDKLGDLAPLLVNLVSDAGLRERIGAAARQYAAATFNRDAYGERLAAFLEEVRGSRRQ